MDRTSLPEKLEHRARWFAPIVTQAPVVLASHLGVTDIAALIRFQSFGLVAIPLAIWVGALAAQWRNPLYWAFVVMFAAVLLREVRPAGPATGRSSRRRPAARCR